MYLTPEEHTDDLTTCEGWQAWALREELTQPERLSAGQLKALDERERQRYAARRRRWHAGMPPIKTGPLRHVHSELELQLQANGGASPGDPRPAVLIDAAPNVGKSTIPVSYTHLTLPTN